MTNRCLVYLFVFGAKVITSVMSSTIDEIILNATETTNESAYLQFTDGEVKVEFDMIFTAEQWEEIQQLNGNETHDSSSSSSRHKRKAIRDESFRWTGGVIPYKISPGVFTSAEEQKITEALEEWQNYTCISFRLALPSDTNFVVFDNGSGCSSYVGMIKGNQTIKLKDGCRTVEVVLHEVGHALGFWHEQSRPDRDNYVEILSQNIKEEQKYNFVNYPSSYLNLFDIPYDYGSIMHYGRKYFTENGSDTIRTKDPKYQDVIGTAKHLSFRDIKMANLMYRCSEKAGCTNVKCRGEGFQNKNCECMCPGSPVRSCADTTPGPGDGASTETNAVIKLQSEPCVDKDSSCEDWSGKGFCQGKNAVHVRNSCPKACGLCL